MGIDTLSTTKMPEEDLELSDKGRLTHCEMICFLGLIAVRLAHCEFICFLGDIVAKVAKMVCSVSDRSRCTLHEFGVFEDFWPRGFLIVP